MRALICGSMAYDTIMVFHDQFKNHILPDQVHILNVSFLVPDLRREFGGCAGNIAYNLKLLGGDPAPMATVGKDFEPYSQWLGSCSISKQLIHCLEDTFTAQAYITTDMDDNQITAFHPGAMSMSHVRSIPMDQDFEIGMVSPDGKDGMIQHAEQFSNLNIPFIFDPGQGMPMFDGDELLAMLEQSTWVTLNDYEAKLMQEKTGLSPELIAERVEAVVVTRGANGSHIFTKKKCFDISPAKPEKVSDPTGCGDAYRAGLLYGLQNSMDWETTGRIASLMGAIKVETHGTQNHSFSLEEFSKRFHENFDYQF